MDFFEVGVGQLIPAQEKSKKKVKDTKSQEKIKITIEVENLPKKSPKNAILAEKHCLTHLRNKWSVSKVLFIVLAVLFHNFNFTMFDGMELCLRNTFPV